MPGLDKRNKDALMRRMEGLAVSYTPEWRLNVEKPDMGTALALLYAKLVEGAIDAHNQTPELHFREFINAVGCKAGEARPASGYMTFGLAKPDMPEVVVNAGWEVVSAGEDGDVSFVTSEDVYVSSSSVNVQRQPAAEEADGGKTRDCWLFVFDRPVQRGVISLLFLLRQWDGTGQRQLTWEYHGLDGWRFLPVEDGTECFAHTGIVRFAASSDFEKLDRDGVSGWCVRVYCDEAHRLPPIIPSVYINGAAVISSDSGIQTNLKPWSSNRLKKTVGFVTDVRNPDYFAGGCEQEGFEAASARTRVRLRHGFRAVTPGDYERLAREICRDLVKVKCFPGYDGSGVRTQGAVAVVVLEKDFLDAQPYFFRIREQLEHFFKDKAGGPVLTGAGLYITAPRFIRMDVKAVLCVESHQLVMKAQAEAEHILRDFIHPVTGGYEGQGWDFGTLPDHIQIKNCIRHVQGLVYIKQVVCLLREEKDGVWQETEWETVSCFPWALPLAGTCQVDVEVG